MKTNSLIPIGYQSLITTFNIQTIPYYRASYVSKKGGKQMFMEHSREIHIYPKNYQLSNPHDPFLNLEFALKHEGMSLPIIKLVFKQLSIDQIEHFIMRKPQGKAERQLWYLFEFLMNKQLNIKDLKIGNYIDLLNPKNYYTAKAIKIKRQRINNNLLGFSHFCPFVRRTPTLSAYEKMHLNKVAKNMLADYEPLVTQRAASYLYTKETVSSWRIEHEEPTKMRAINFVKLLRQAQDINNLTKKELIRVQHVIVDPRFAESNYRSTQNYIAQTVRIGYSVIHYISPRAKDVPLLMDDLLLSLERMLDSEVHPVIIAAAISFGFVFIHPFEDGNGRLHRFLIHYILAYSLFTPPDIIFPISAIMLAQQKKYDQMLESFSKPLMDLLIYDENADGVITVENNNAELYAYLDYTCYAEYLFACIEKTIQTDLKKELAFIVAYDAIKKSIQEIIDMPDRQLDLLIKLILQNKGELAQSKKEKFFSMLTDKELKKIEQVVAKQLNTDNIDAELLYS